MKNYLFKELQADPELFERVCDEASSLLLDGGIICVPCQGSYRVLADLTNEDAVKRLLQTKRRTRKAPSLVFVADEKVLQKTVAEIPGTAQNLLRRYWPGQLTILFTAHPELPGMVLKQLNKAHGKIGVRVPESRLLRNIVSALGRPVLVSSANRESKHGASSPAQVKKNFASAIVLFVDAGDLPSAPSSTVVDINEQGMQVTRPGSIDAAELLAVAGQ